MNNHLFYLTKDDIKKFLLKNYTLFMDEIEKITFPKLDKMKKYKDTIFVAYTLAKYSITENEFCGVKDDIYLNKWYFDNFSIYISKGRLDEKSFFDNDKMNKKWIKFVYETLKKNGHEQAAEDYKNDYNTMMEQERNKALEKAIKEVNNKYKNNDFEK